MVRLFTPFIARQVAGQFAREGLTPEQAAAKMRADIGHTLSADEERLVAAVVSRLPIHPSQVLDERPISVWVLLAANLVPLAGVLLWGWDVFALLLLFWMENVVIGVLNVAKMLLADPADAALWAAKLFMAPFFCFHYGMFTAIHGTFVFALFGARKYDASGINVVEPALRAAGELGLWLPLGALVASHAFSFLWNYLFRGEFRRARLAELMAKPYGRVVVLHLTILFGGFGAMALGSPVWALLLLVALKVGLDVRAHVKEHSQT
ncbi:MAG TPA: DUF6498-containing protein [Burkholderiales bacterium]|nr:DUF6498-containing protein [Burkholderiales bacterium]